MEHDYLVKALAEAERAMYDEMNKNTVEKCWWSWFGELGDFQEMEQSAMGMTKTDFIDELVGDFIRYRRKETVEELKHRVLDYIEDGFITPDNNSYYEMLKMFIKEDTR
jgi:hypothetical protein|tara:strand:- start:223 stop:549 length:327 start_codon:yes stop_codon:yes gene_type:complete